MLIGRLDVSVIRSPGFLSSPQAKAVAGKEETKRRAIRYLIIGALRVLCPVLIAILTSARHPVP